MLVTLNNIRINCNANKSISNIGNVTFLNNNAPIANVIDPILQGLQYHININQKPTLALPKRLINIMDFLFDDLNELMNRNEFLLARNTADKIFEACTSYWLSLLSNGQHILAKEFWIELLNLAFNWEGRHGIEIHKGTPYFFLAHTCLLLDDVENTFIYLSRAVGEDERSCKRLNQNFKDAPGFKTISLSVSRNNFMYYKVQEVRNYLLDKLVVYNKKLRKKLTFRTVERKFFQNPDYVEPMVFLNFLIHILKTQEDSIKKLNNDFSKLRILNLIFGLCLITDKILWIRFAKKYHYISGNAKHLCKIKKWCSKRYIRNVYFNAVKEDIQSENITKFEGIIDKLINYKLEYRGVKVKKEIQILLLLWGLRNQGAHRLEKQNILIREYEKIIQCLINAFFMSTY